MKDLESWTHIVIEAFCAINWDYNAKHSKYTYQLNHISDPDADIKFIKVPNSDYVPGIKRPKPPKFCQRKICYACLSNNCTYLAYGESTEAKEILEQHLDEIWALEEEKSGDKEKKSDPTPNIQ